MADLMLPVNLKSLENAGKEPRDGLGKQITPHHLKKTDRVMSAQCFLSRKPIGNIKYFSCLFETN